MELGKKAEGSSMRLVQQLDEQKHRKPAQFIFEILLTVTLSVGCWYTFFSMFPNPVEQWILVVSIIIFPSGIYCLFRNRFIANFMIFYLFLFIAVYFAFAYAAVWNGFLVMANIVVETLNNQLGLGLLTFEIQGDVADWSRQSLMAVIPVILLVSAAIAYSVHHKQPLLGFLYTALPVVVGLCLKALPSIWLLCLLILSWTGLFLLALVARPNAGRKKRPIGIQNEKQSLLPFFFLGTVLVILVTYVLAFSGEDYKPPEKVEDAKAAIIQVEEWLRYDKIGGDKIDQLSQGDLTKTHVLAYTDTPVLKLEMQQSTAMYLRGFSGGYYENQKWKPLAEEAYGGDFKGIMEWLSQEEFYPWMQTGLLYEMAPNFDHIKVSAKNVNGNSKYLYLPYEAAVAGDAMPDQVNYRKDWGAFSKGILGSRNYDFTIFLPQDSTYNLTTLNQWLETLAENNQYEDYLNQEGVYRRFVYQSYLAVPENVVKVLSSSGIDQCAGRMPQYVLQYIQKLFAENYTYNVAQGECPEGQDELDYFMNTAKAGDDMHFATAAALLFRRAGIPARYAEGYYLSPETADLYQGMADVKLDVLDSQAHSWVEIYIDQLGWVPVEVIPGFFTLEKKQTEEKEADSKVKEKNETLYHDEVPQNDQPDKEKTGDAKGFNIPWIVLFVVLIMAVVYEIIGRYLVNKRHKKFDSVFTKEQAYVKYRYISKLMALDGFSVSAHPYEQVDAVSHRYDGATDMTFSQLLEMVHRIRFGRCDLTEQEHKKMALYAKQLSSHIYSGKSKWKQFLMKFIFFYV